jgi:hypothetical protein
MIEHHPDDIGESLGRLVPLPVPSGLRRRIMASVLESRKNAVLTPRMRVIATICLVLASMAMAWDAVISKRQSGRIAALLGGPGVSNPAGEEIGLLWAELGSDLGDLDKLRREGILFSCLGSRHGSPGAYFKAQDRLKGMIDHEDPENYY